MSFTIHAFSSSFIWASFFVLGFESLSMIPFAETFGADVFEECFLNSSASSTDRKRAAKGFWSMVTNS